MPEYAYTYHDGTFQIITYSKPQYRDDVFFISEWKFDDISSGSGLDSQNSNNLMASGSPTQVTGWQQSSGVEFDGTDDAFWLNWAAGSGLEGVIADRLDLTAQNAPNMTVLAHLYVPNDAFDQDRILFSKWNDVGSDREWMIGINPSGGIFWQFKKDITTVNYALNTAMSGLIPQDEWFRFGFSYHGVDSSSSTTGSSIVIHINDKLFVQCVGTYELEDAGASGIFAIGAANIDLNPSGHFKGKMENVQFHNGRTVQLDEWRTYQSGIAPLTQRYPINDFHPSLIGHWKFDKWNIGDVQHLTDTRWIDERKYSQRCFASGTGDPDIAINIRDGAKVGSSGMSCVKSSTAKDYIVKNNNELPDVWVNGIRQNMTILYWLKPALTNNNCGVFGWKNNSPYAGPFTLNLSANSHTGHRIVFEGPLGGTINTNQPTNALLLVSGLWSHCATSWNIGSATADNGVSGVFANPDGLLSSGLWTIVPKFDDAWGYLRHFIGNSNVTYSGMIDEMLVFNEHIPQYQITEFFNSQSGYNQEPIVEPEKLGGYVQGKAITMGSGFLGSFVKVGESASKTIGGYTSGWPNYESGVLGAFIIAPPSTSGALGSYYYGKAVHQNKMGGYIYSKNVPGDWLGAYTIGAEATEKTSDFWVFFNVIGRDKKEFDAQVKMFKALSAQFDAKAIVYIDERKPLVSIIDPATHQSGMSLPWSYKFIANASGLDGKSIVATSWFFSDVTATSGSTISSSGTYETEHTFSQSGVFDAIFLAIDDKGIVNSDRRIINTASGLSVPTISLTATPESGVAPLSVAFSGVINTAPYPIVDSYLYFGDNTFSTSTISIYKLYTVPGCYIPVFRVRDSRGVIVTDTTVIGVNN